ncbi:MAG: Bifunctional adenosylcobalamin biosynthesis protein CobU [Dehalococcoidia bacterium]|nr:Bifunctional adenosylcobalamin biosynthesis protein CobU [Chloroflexota bacterium]MBT9161593.1 Bifunctional adenosylcobalamin biosynthesis protein CobU [Chloroflexota bacterium]
MSPAGALAEGIEVLTLDRRCILILGGARSGKSRFAENLAGTISGKVLFIATAEALDEEMKTRIAEHQRQRPSSWQTLEAPTDVTKGIAARIGDAEIVLIDCLTLLVSNLMLGEERGLSESGGLDTKDAENRVVAEIETLAEFIQKTSATFIIVSNEVGLGLVSENRLGRVYCDLLGRANQLIARYANEVYFMVAGIPMKVKG